MNKKPESRYHVLVVDDDREMRESLIHLLERAGWHVDAYAQAAGAIKAVRETNPDVVLSDVRMPGMSGLELLNAMQGDGFPPVVLISAHGDIEMAVTAMRDGAYSFVEKPFDPRRLLTILGHASENYRLARDADRLRQRLSRLSGLDRILLGDTNVIRDLREDILDMAETEAPVMILGETGTGKELVAHALHDLSARISGPFIALNCATISEQNFEEEMFGRADGALGTIASANRGTLFLDELGACSEAVQAKMLRVIETQEFTPVGATMPVTVDIRVISASNEKLDVAVAEKRFREDLFFRLNAFVIDVPPLRERRDDIPLLFTHFLVQNASVNEIGIPELAAEDIAALMTYDWPGNVRELRHTAERRILAARRGRGSVAVAIKRDFEADDVPETLREAVAAFERQLIANAIRKHQGRMDEIAEALGIGRRTLNEKIVKLGLNKSDLLY
ncbi:sigma-54-dependent Fis family transcriptional regulator [Rhodobacterales bacterium 52_120_T64]|nr:sigma-54-dependent Fis family transcriptional regulator [Rhodobacterales bacterium 52_120_T64]